jgi:two-component system, NtrC family, sensor kinase
VESTRPLGAVSVADQDYFRKQRDSGSIFVGQLPQGATGEGKIPFTRRLSAANGDFDGVVIVPVDAAYFVSGYDASQLGEHGVLGILGTDGIFRVRRSGDSMFSGDAIDVASLLPKPDEAEAEPQVSRSSWDGTRRWISAREIYGFPLAIVVGLSQDEQLAPVKRDSIVYIWRAAAGSLGIVLLTALLGRISWQLAQSRLRESESKLEHVQQTAQSAH